MDDAGNDADDDDDVPDLVENFDEASKNEAKEEVTEDKVEEVVEKVEELKVEGMFFPRSPYLNLKKTDTFKFRNHHQPKFCLDFVNWFFVCVSGGIL